MQQQTMASGQQTQSKQQLQKNSTNFSLHLEQPGFLGDNRVEEYELQDFAGLELT